ncbi:MAG: rod shape-determining protein MreC [Alphaproteobacteria bacterium]|nr:rod shape-determining protein MreC [Alphaproteobacteria bacterium]
MYKITFCNYKAGAKMAIKSTTSKISSRLSEIIRAFTAASLLPVFFFYILLDKPDYKIMNAVRHVIVPTAHVVGDALSWPFRAFGRSAANFYTLTQAKRENEELRVRLDAALSRQSLCDTAIMENQRLETLLGIARDAPLKTIIARAVLEYSAFRHTTLSISKGTADGIREGQAVISTDGSLLGVVAEVFENSARVRGLEDTKSNIPVRVAGSEVYGFLRGNGERAPIFEFFSDQEFVPTRGIRLVSSGIRGNLPNGIFVGVVDREGKIEARVKLGAQIGGAQEVIVLQFDGKDGYR